MIGYVLYLAIGFVLSTLVMIFLSWADPGDNSPKAYITAGMVGLTVWLAWPIAVPFAFFAGLAYYISENYGRGA